MAIARRSPHHQDPPLPTARKHHSRRSPATRRLRSTSSEIIDKNHFDRPVLVPVHFNLRRLPSRRCLPQQSKSEEQDSHMARHVVRAGSKRKRVGGTGTSNENIANSTRAGPRSKRLRTERAYATRHMDYSTASDEDTLSEDSEHDFDQDNRSEMEIDGSNAEASDSIGSEEDLSEEEEEDEEEDQGSGDELSDGEDDESSDEHLLYSAEPKQLQRLRKDDLIRLYGLAGLPDDPETWTKSEIISAIVDARDDFAELPPSSPPRGDGNSSDGYSSDDGNIAGDEETDAGSVNGQNYFALRRRATMDDAGKLTSRPMKGRSTSLGNFEHEEQRPVVKRKAHTRVPSTVNANHTRQRSSSRPSPIQSTSSPVITRLRSNRSSSSATSPPPTGQTNPKGKGKASGSSGEKRVKGRQRAASQSSLAEESDLTELDELEASLPVKPSPRRLRSKDKEVRREPPSSETQKEPPAKKRKLPTRRAKGKVKSLRESDLEEDLEEVEEEEEEGGEEELESGSEGEEVDELESPAATPPPVTNARTPLRRRLRPRQRPAPPSDGDDEGGDADEAEEEEELDEEATEVGDDEAEVEEDQEEEEEDVDEPRRLRNGKVVGEEEEEEEEAEEDVSMSVEGDEEEDIEHSDGEEEEEEGEEVDEAEEEVDAEGEVEGDEAMEEDDVDLTIATAKTLIRLRRDDLVRLCETRHLDTDGTKPQLAEALLQWRDSQYPSSPSSTGTVRPSSITRRRRRHGSQPSPPILLRDSHHMHPDEAATPVPTMIQREKSEPDHELELDLESLGLEDREIPPEKLLKLEKIGSGGFKDVFVGKFKGRKVAIAEFRGQLSAMDIKELKLLGGFDHPNIVRFLGVSIPENTRETPVMIVSELCSNGDLFDYIRNVQAPPLHKVLSMMLDIARGLEYLHMMKPSVIHRDCKSSNILITARGTAKIADFGLAKVKQSTRSMVRSLVGTVNWQAPELWTAHPKYNHKVDVFSCAMVFWEMLQWHSPNIKFPWEGMNEHAIYDIVGAKRQRPSMTGLRKLWCPELIDLVERMWAHDPGDRPTMSEVVEALEEIASNR